MSKNRRLKKKMKNMLTTVATLVLIVGVSIGVTLALLSARTNTKKNTFTGSKGVQGSTYEDLWDDSTPERPEPSDEPEDPYYGINQSNPYTPGMVINKNPKVANLSEGEEIWVMMRVEYTIDAKTTSDGSTVAVPITYSEFSKLARIYTGDEVGTKDGTIKGTGSETINTNWNLYDKDATTDSSVEYVLWTDNDADITETPKSGTLAEGFDKYYSVATEKEGNHIYYYYYYSLPLDSKDGNDIDSTDPLFTTVHINSQTATYDNIFLTKADDEQIYQIPDLFGSTNYYTYSSLPGFSINVESAIIARDTLKDPTNLTTTESGKTEISTILEELKSVFDAYDAKR